jgi:hypothetical protein
MRLIARYESRTEAEERAAFLRSRGIATHVTNMTSLRPNLAHQGRFRAGLWAMLEPQYADAEALLENPDHEVERPLSEAQMGQMDTEGEAHARRTLIKWLVITAVALGALAAIVAALGI